MSPKALASEICPDLKHSIGKRGDREFIVTSFTYPDGDAVLAYIQGRGTHFSDLGTTLYRLHQYGLGITSNRNQIISTICEQCELEFDGEQITKRIQPGTAGESLVDFCEGIQRIISLRYQVVAPQISDFKAKVDRVITDFVAPNHHVYRRWTWEEKDRNRAFPVDYHINGGDKSWNIFHVSSAGKAIMSVAVSEFLRARGLKVPTMMIVNPEYKVQGRSLKRIQAASQKLSFGVDSQQILDFVQ